MSKQWPVFTCFLSFGGVWESPSFLMMDSTQMKLSEVSVRESPVLMGCEMLPQSSYPAVLVDGLQPFHSYISDMAPPEQDLA